MAHRHSSKAPLSSPEGPQETATAKLKFTEDEWAVLSQSRTGRFALDEVHFYEECRKWRKKEVEDYWNEIIDLAWHKYQWDKLDVPVEESVRATLRILVRRTLQRYKYPPDKTPEAIELIMKQAEVLSNGWSQ